MERMNMKNSIDHTIFKDTDRRLLAYLVILVLSAYRRSHGVGPG
jgi:hypothetical protein